MPWHVEERGDEYCVIKDADGENEGCHPSREAANRQMAALYANEAGKSLDFAAKLLHQDDDTAVVGSWGVIYGGKDLDGETFTPETDYMLDLVPDKLAFYDHAQKVKHIIGKANATPLDDGIWVQMELDRHRDYVDAILSLIDEKALGMSSGSVAHLVEKEAGVIKRWPIIEFSLTPTPAEPRTLGVERIKSLAEDYPELKALLPKDAASVNANATGGEDAAKMKITEVEIMSDEVKEAPQTETPPAEDATKRFDALEAKMADLSEALNKIIPALEKEPALERAGYVTNYGGKADEGTKSFGDFLLAVARKDVTRLAKVYKSYETKDMLESQGTLGGFLVPTEFGNRLLEIAVQASPIYSRVTQMPVMSNSGTFPALDYSVAPTAGSGQTALAAQLSAATTEEGVALTEDTPAFEEITWRLHKIGGFTQVSQELQMDSPMAIETLLTRLFSIVIANKNERNIIRGSGAGEPLGILNAACTIAVTTASDNTFAEADALTMFSRFKPIGGGEPVWLMHQGVIPDLNGFSATNQELVDWPRGLSGTLLGYPIIYSEHMPQDDADDVILADLSAYLWFQKGAAMEVAFSEHFAFTSQLGTWTFTQRNDGMPWLSAAITLADPTGSFTVSPFVYHDD